jgi:hypothetical protein
MRKKKFTKKNKRRAVGTTTAIQLRHDVNAATAVDKQTEGAQIPEQIDDTEVNLGPEMSKWLAETFGNENRALQSRLHDQGVSAVTDFAGKEIKTLDYVAFALRGMKPRDSLEGMLGTQMVAAHTLAMTLVARAALPNQTDLGVEVNVNRAVKLMRLYGVQIAALARYRGKSEQKMTVEHVHVHPGGQAIVGQVTTKSNKRTE